MQRWQRKRKIHQKKIVMRSNLLPVAKEGWRYIGYSALVFVLFSILDIDLLQIFSLLLILFFIAVFRNPERETPLFQENSVVSPVDGTVTAIEELDDKEYAYKIEIESNYLNVALLRAPLTSSIENIDSKKGARLSESETLFEKLNEYSEIIFKDKNANGVKVVHRLKRSFDSMHINASASQNIVQGSRYGVMLNGVTTLFLPQNFRINVNIGNEVTASQTLIGYFSKK